MGLYYIISFEIQDALVIGDSLLIISQARKGIAMEDRILGRMKSWIIYFLWGVKGINLVDVWGNNNQVVDRLANHTTTLCKGELIIIKHGGDGGVYPTSGGSLKWLSRVWNNGVRPFILASSPHVDGTQFEVCSSKEQSLRAWEKSSETMPSWMLHWDIVIWRYKMSLWKNTVFFLPFYLVWWS